MTNSNKMGNKYSMLNDMARKLAQQSLPPDTVQHQQPAVQQPAQAPIQYSLAKSQQWADSTKQPNIMEFVGKVNHVAQQPGGTAKYSKDLMMIIKAMSGDKNAYMQLLQRSGGLLYLSNRRYDELVQNVQSDGG